MNTKFMLFQLEHVYLFIFKILFKKYLLEKIELDK